MKRLILILALLISGVATAQETKSVKITDGPYLQAVGENEFTVVWRTNQEAVAWVEIAPDDGTHFYNKERPRYFQTRFGRKVLGTLHTIRVTGLEPATTYRYRIISAAAFKGEKDRVRFTEKRGSDVYRRQPYSVTTLDRNKESISFAMVNDIHAKTAELETLLADASKRKYDFVCFNGDMTSRNNSQQEVFDLYLSSATRLFAKETPLYFVRGNHETRGAYATALPELFPSKTGMPYYSFRQGPAYFIVLDCGEDKPDSDMEYSGLACYDQYRTEQAEWLRSIVASEEYRTAPVKILFCHIPPETKGWHGAADIHQKFVPILNEAGLDLWLAGHIHKYRLTEAGENGCNFPVLCNPNVCRLDAEVTANGVDIKIFDVNSKLLHTYQLKK
ncbi:MAG: metallophosphoesterase family protein [Rikenellaceae bacterium]|nr:metallophosphoesterase family protein [Rikenellaceae bacterium]